MAVQVPGTLRVVERSGRYGQFCVGELACDIGTFSVRNKILDEFTAGTYEGIFSVMWIWRLFSFRVLIISILSPFSDMSTPVSPTCPPLSA